MTIVSDRVSRGTVLSYRTVGVVVCDDAVLYSPIHLDEMGNVRGLTKASFSLVPSASEIGNEWVDAFESLWSVASPMTTAHGR